ncbi:MAG: immunity 26/phosphotriesterase HocA family protein [Lachnospiraceae bacterium]|nr:immunity 26/phosphotriesterase HocA family protein [Lachnospiraceae bacterium]
MTSNNLLIIKKSSKKPKEGDVFVLQPVKNLFYFGKVIQTNLKSVDSFVNGMSLIYVYKHCSVDKILPNGLENEELLIAPMIVNNQPWSKGFFETIGNIKVTESERKIDFAFWDVLQKKFVDIDGQEILHTPKYSSTYGLGSFGIIGKEVQKAIKMLETCSNDEA